MSLFKRIVLIAVFAGLLCISATTFARPLRQDSGAQVVTDDVTGLTTFIGINTNSAGLSRASSGTPDATAALADIGLYAADFGLQNPAQELQFSRISSDAGSVSFRYQQVYQGIPILAGELIANYDASGQLAALSGEISPNSRISTTPTIGASSASSIAINAVATTENVAANLLTASAPSLWIYDPHLISPDTFATRLVWRTEVTDTQGVMPIRYLVLVDAHLNGIALIFNQVDVLHAPEAINLHADNRPSANIIASNPASVLPAPNFPNPTARTYNANFKPSLPGTLMCSNIPSALSGPGSCQGGSSGTTDANAAHFFGYGVFNFYDAKFGRNSINNAGLGLRSTVNYRKVIGQAYLNAFWNGSQMVYGDADIFTADDVVGHELTHGVTQYESNLFYWYESGAINESMSDIFGELFDQSNGIDRFGNPDEVGDKWIMGEDMNDFRLERNMADPGLSYFTQPDRTQSVDYDVDTFLQDNGGVHINSGIGNKAAYLMAQGDTFNGYTITALGNDKTGAIFYLVNSTLLTSGSNYETLGAALVQACNNILAGANPLGMTAGDCTETSEAVLATQMNIDPIAAVDFTPEAEVCAAGTVPAYYLFNDDIENGLGNFVAGTFPNLNPSNMPASKSWQEASTIDFIGGYATSGTKSLYGVNHPAVYGNQYNSLVYESFVRMANNVTIPPASTYYLRFNHSVALGFQSLLGRYDGAVLEYSLNNSNTWNDAQSLFDSGKDYDGEIYGPFGNPLNGRDGFLATSHGYVSSRYDLSSLAGNNVRFRWVIGTGSGYAIYGWFLDDIQIYRCVVPAPQIAVEGPDGVNIADGGTFNIGTTPSGTPINRTITVRNTGQLDLTISTNPPTVTGDFSAGSFASTTIAPGESTTFTVSCNANLEGSITGTLSFGNNDATANPFNFGLACTVTEPSLTASPIRNVFDTNTPTLTWNPLTWAVDIYEIQIADNSAFNNAFTDSINSIGTTSYTLINPLPNGLYYWRVRGRNTGKTGAWGPTETMVIAAP